MTGAAAPSDKDAEIARLHAALATECQRSATQADTIARLSFELSASSLERERQFRELQGLRRAEEAELVSVGANAIADYDECGESSDREACIAGRGCVCADQARAVLAAIAPRIRAAERERAASLAPTVATSLAANGATCGCGNGRVPVTAYRDACAAYAAAIRAGDVDG